MQPLSLRLFGHPELRSGATPLAIGRRHVLALVTILAETGRPLPRGRIADMLWPATDDATARPRSRRLLPRLGQCAGRGATRTAGETLALGEAIAVDSRSFAARAENGLRTRDIAALREAA